MYHLRLRVNGRLYTSEQCNLDDAGAYDIMDDLRLGATLMSRFYTGRFLLGAVTTRMVQFCRHSPRFEQIVQDLLLGSQSYLGLRERLWDNLSGSLLEIVTNLPSYAVGLLNSRVVSMIVAARRACST